MTNKKKMDLVRRFYSMTNKKNCPVSISELSNAVDSIETMCFSRRKYEEEDIIEQVSEEFDIPLEVATDIVVETVDSVEVDGEPEEEVEDDNLLAMSRRNSRRGYTQERSYGRRSSTRDYGRSTRSARRW